MADRVKGHALRRTIVNKFADAGQEVSVLSWACECGQHLGDAPDVTTHGVRVLWRQHKAADVAPQDDGAA